VKIQTNTKEKKIKNPLKSSIPTINHPIKSPTTFAKLSTILRGAAETVESISFKLNFFAYSRLYFSQKVACAIGITAAYQILFIKPKSKTNQSVSTNQNIKRDHAERILPKRTTLNTQIFAESFIKKS
jgi:hypothetical protein